MQGKLILVVGTPGSGKGALIAHLRQAIPDIVFPRSCVTRPMRPTEKDGEVYFFVSNEEFDRLIAQGELLEWVVNDLGNRYGTLRSEIVPALEEGKLVLREVEVRGARAIKEMLPKGSVVTIYIDGGSWENLRQRILLRAPLTEEELQSRRERYERERVFKDEADYVIANPDGKVEEAKEELLRVVESLRIK